MTIGDPITAWAASGIVPLTGTVEGPPLVPPGCAATVARQLTTRIAQFTDGRVVLDGAQLLSERAAFTGGRRRGDVAVSGSCRLLPTADGWAAVSCARPDDPLLLGALVEKELSNDLWLAVAAWLASHTGQELADRAELIGVAATPILHGDAPPPSLPEPLVPRDMSSLLVIDFSTLWAGPLCAHLLGLAGARVVKVETPTRLDGARHGNPEFYGLLHAGHRSIVLDPSTDHGRTAVAKLVRTADVVIEASRPRALAGFGLDAEVAVADGVTWVSITAAGRACNRVGFGDDIAAGAGLVAWTEHGTPVFVGDAIADPLTGLTAAALAMTMPRNGSATLWEVAMADVIAATLDAVGDLAVPSSASWKDEHGWWAPGCSAPVPVASPRHRVVAGEARPPGADTAEVLAELDLPLS
jgi:crotonobetainyl-CoA:carnitine CoA-transferase CaiB-like acyl-CoA transferase